MASVIDPEKRKKLLAKGSPYMKDGEVVPPTLELATARKRAYSTPNDGYIIAKNVPAPKGVDPLIDPNSPESVAAAQEQVARSANALEAQAAQRWAMNESVGKDRYAKFLAMKGTTPNVFNGGSMIEDERQAQSAMDQDRSDRGRINRYARKLERSRNVGGALELLKLAKDEFGNPISNTDILRNRYLEMVRRSGGRRANANPYSSASKDSVGTMLI